MNVQVHLLRPVVFLIFSLIFYVESEKCKESEITQIQTDCHNGKLWILDVPKNEEVCDAQKDYKSIDCETACQSGQYFSLSKQGCSPCEAGTFSSGDEVVINDFTSSLDIFEGDVLLSNYDDIKSCEPLNDPLGTGFFSWNDHLRVNSFGKCFYNVGLKLRNRKKGYISFEYQQNDDSYKAFFSVRNSSCVLRPDSNNLLANTFGTEYWNKFEQKIEPGLNYFHWTIGPRYSYTYSYYPGIVNIRNIKITGVQSQIQCTPCKIGYYGDKAGMSSCNRCPPNTFSKIEGSSSCTSCEGDYFSEAGATECKKRRNCSDEDFDEFFTECSPENKANVERRLRKPNICNDPAKEERVIRQVECKSCPLGTIKDSSNRCISCKKGDISDGNKCRSCGPDEAPIYGILIDSWFRPHESLIFKTDNKALSVGPIYRGDHLTVGEGLSSNVIETLIIQTPDGYRVPLEDDSINKWIYYMKPLFGTFFEVDFELDCYGNCTFRIIQDIDYQKVVIKTWSGRQTRMKYKISMDSPRIISTELQFSKSSIDYIKNWNSQLDYKDRLNIYRIETINTESTSAIKCQKCPLGVDKGKCVACKNGFLTENQNDNGTYCQMCPSNTIVVADSVEPLTINQACHECSPGSKAVSGSYCAIDVMPYFESTGRVYNLENLLEVQEGNGPKLFDKDNNPYYHKFKFSLAYGENSVSCHDSDVNQAVSPMIRSQVCKYTHVDTPSKINKTDVNYTSRDSTNLGSYLQKVVPTNSSKEFAKKINKRLEELGWIEDYYLTDLHYYFKNDNVIKRCPNGVTTIITLRCSLNMIGFQRIGERTELGSSKIGRIELPPRCIDGTCDGCNYHILWVSYEACPICRPQDYFKFRGPCENGQQEINLYAPYGCRSYNQTLKEYVPCPYLSRSGKFVVAIVILLIGFLFFLSISFYYNNKKLKYKYQKLVEYNQNQKTSRAPEETGCGIPEEFIEDPYPIHFDGGENKGSNYGENIVNSIKGSAFKINFKKQKDDKEVLTFNDANDPANHEL